MPDTLPPISMSVEAGTCGAIGKPRKPAKQPARHSCPQVTWKARHSLASLPLAHTPHLDSLPPMEATGRTSRHHASSLNT